MFKRWTLSARLVATVALTVAIVLLVFAGLTAFRLQDGAARQKSAVGALARERFDAQLQLEAQLAASFLERIQRDVDGAVAGLAERSETREVIRRGNIVSIDVLMQKVARSASLDGILVLDRDLKALGSQLPGLNLLASNNAIEASPLSKVIRQLLDDQNPDKPRSYQAYHRGDAAFSKAMGLDYKPDSLLLLAIYPVFDDFGDVSAFLFGQKVVTGEETILRDFARTWNLSIELRDGDRVLMQSGFSDASVGERNSLSRCRAFADRWSFCVRTPRSHLEEQTGQLIQFIEQEKFALTRWLLSFSIISLLAATLIACIATRHVLAPLAQITRVVRSVAKGNWLAGVAGQKRRDEVGEIARAVAVLQRSVKEREQLQAGVADVEQVRQQRSDLIEAMKACRSVLRQRLFGISDMVEQIEQGARRLDSNVSLATGEADEARLVALRAFGKGAALQAESDDNLGILVRDAIDRLGETVATIGVEGLDTVNDIGKLAQDIRGLDHVVKRFLGDLDAVPELPVRALRQKTLLESA